MAGRDRPRNVLFVTPWYPTDEHPYAGIFVREHAKAAQRHNRVAVVHVVFQGPAAPGRRPWALIRETNAQLTAGIPTYRLELTASLRPRFFAGVRCLSEAARQVAKEYGAIDVIHSHVFSIAMYGALLGMLKGIPTVVTEHSSAFLLRSLSSKERMKALMAFRLARRVLPVSEVLKDAIEAYGFRARFHVVPNAVDPEVFATCPRSHPESGPRKLLFVGNLIDLKGLPFLLTALPQVLSSGRSVHLDVVGRGPQLDAYRRMADDLGVGDRVSFLGTRSKNEIAELLGRADVFVLPSTCETFSVATAEALMCGVPVLVTRCGGPERFVTERDGALVPVRDPDALASALCNMIDHLHMFDREAIARAAEARFGYAAVGAELDRVYAEVLAER